MLRIAELGSVAKQTQRLTNIFVRTSYLKTKQLPCTLVNIKQIDVSYGGLCHGTTGIKEFCRQATGKKIKASNPEAVINVVFDNLLNKPSAVVTYKNGSKLDLEPEGKTVNEIFELLKQKENQLFMEANKESMDAYVKKQLKEVQDGVNYWTKKHQEMIQELKKKEVKKAKK